MNNNIRLRFWVLVIIVFISGFSQGMLLPLIAIILENSGVSSTINGLHATGLYIGVLLASPLMEAPLRRFGYKPLIVVGGLAIIISLFAFTLWDSLWFWFFLRLIIGVGDHALHFSTQTWITAFSPENVRGRNISIYGLSFGMGFAFGPLIAQLVTINESLPFILSSAVSLIAWATIFFIKNEHPEKASTGMETNSLKSTFKRFTTVLKCAWAPVLPAFCYGLLEASLNSNFPVFGLRSGFELEKITFVVSSFLFGGIIFQLPLGLLSDKFGRKRILSTIMLLGSIIFVFCAIYQNSFIILAMNFFIAGMLLGSTYSLSIAYITDVLPRALLPAGNLVIGICFSIGSITGPFVGGLALQYLPNISMFYFISGILLIIFLSLLKFKPKEIKENRLAS